MNKDVLKKQVGKDWFSIVDKAMNEKATLYIKQLNKEELSKYLFYPEPENIFRAFRETSFKDLKVIILGQDCYPNGEATGIAFDVKKNKHSKTPPSFDKIAEAYNDSFPTSFNPDMLVGNLLPWCNQGVLLLNSALTVQRNKPGVHSKYWEPFIVNLLKELKKDQSLIFISIGAIALKNFKSAGINKNCITLEHPDFAVRQNRLWKYDNFFELVNNCLIEMNKKEIEW
jgi:uracil-DNA glycosylase